jgi:tetratricopeptide (TPR) repeat protein
VTSAAGDIGDVANAYLETGNYQRATEVLQSALAEDPSNAGLLTQYARARLGLKDHWGAASAAHSALAAEPNNEHAMRLYALALQGQHRLPEALWVAWKTVTEHPDVHLAHYTYASMLRESGRLRDALFMIDEALRLNPASADALVLRGDIHRAFGASSAAEADYHEALRLEPDHAAAVHNLAVNRLRLGKTTKAVHGFLGAGRLDPALGQLARKNIGVALIRVLRLATASVVFLAVALIVVMALHQGAQSTVVPRVFAGALTLALAAVIVWVVRSVPRPTLRAVLRERFLLAIRLLFLAFAVIAGLVTTVVGSTPLTDFSGPLLLLGVVGLTVLGWLVGH